MRAVVVIPARFASIRFPGKPLAKDTGLYLVQHVYERAKQARRVERVVVATDDERIVDAVRSFQGEVILTSADHPSGTDRVAEVARGLDTDLVINVQGDEPEMDPAAIDALVDLLAGDDAAGIGTLACPFAVLDGVDPSAPDRVKVVIDGRRRALYFSRALIPFPRGFEEHGRVHQSAPYLLHLGIYAYRPAVLAQLAALPPTPLEQTEKLEQLRWLEHGFPIAVEIVRQAASGIDTPTDYAAFVDRWRAQHQSTMVNESRAQVGGE